jgi:hypothetical protein
MAFSNSNLSDSTQDGGYGPASLSTASAVQAPTIYADAPMSTMKMVILAAAAGVLLWYMTRKEKR